MQRLIIIFLFFIIANPVFSQKIDLQSFIKAWSVSDTSQTHRAEETYNYIKKSRNILSYQQILKQLNTYIRKNPDDRLSIRITMFDVFGKIELNILKRSDYPQEASRILACIKKANKLNDNQLMAELYAQYAEVSPNSSSYVLYNLKAIELQQKVGVNHFTYVANRYYNVAYGLYLNQDFRQSLNYGLKFLSINDKKTKIDPNLYLLINDVIGASYFELKILDSTKFYYRNIDKFLTKNLSLNTEKKELWVSIVKGNIGKVLSLQNKDDKALPLIKEHLRSSLAANSYNNIAMAENNLGAIYLKNKLFDKAELAYRNAYKYAKKDNSLKELILASKGLVDIFKATKRSDSIYLYYGLHQKYRDSLIGKINGGKLSALKASLDFDKMTTNLNDANDAIVNQKLIRKLILAGIFLLAIIAMLIYNRKMLNQRNIASNLVYKQKSLEQQANRAKTEINNFIENISVKNKLIANLQQKLTSDNELINQSLLKYTLVTDHEWDSFRLEFATAYPGFLKKLKIVLPTVNPAEERLAALLHLKVSNNQIASTLGISKDSVSRSKRRLKHRLHLANKIQLEDFISELV